jgi:hypothetical protein
LGLHGLKVPNSAAYYGRTLAALFRLLRGTKCLNLFDVAEKARGKVGYRRVLLSVTDTQKSLKVSPCASFSTHQKFLVKRFSPSKKPALFALRKVRSYSLH